MGLADGASSLSSEAGIAKLKEAIESEFHKSVIRCACCQRPGEWRTKCGRCKKSYYCSRDCQKWAWETHKPECVPFGAAAPKAKPKAKPRPRAAPTKERFDLTDAKLRVSYLEGGGDVGAALAHCRRRLLAAGPLASALVTGAHGAVCELAAPGVTNAPMDVEGLLAGHCKPAIEELKAANPTCALAKGADPKRGALATVPLTGTPPVFPRLRLDDAIPTAFAGFHGVTEALISALAVGTLLADLAGDGPVAAVAGVDGDGDAPKACAGLESAVLVLFSGLEAARPDLPKLYAHVHGGCRNNIVAAAVARKALFYSLEAEDVYRSPTKTGERLLNSRGCPIDTARLFRDLPLDEAAALDERAVETRFGIRGAPVAVVHKALT